MIETKIIPCNGNIKKIYHIADVHIRNLKRHKEYKEVFDRLYQYINDTKTSDSIIVLAGDIVHAKTDMTPEVIEMTQTFLKNLSDMLPTILIPGNHDANLNNSSRLDALSPIVNALNHRNLHYLKDDGAWNMGGLTFIHSSVFGDSKKIVPADDVDGDYKIGLYHGPVDRVKTEHGFAISNKNVNVESFDGYDLVLLGDIHVPNQSLNDEGTIKYCGSTIMQNHSEAKYPEHGLLVWDVDTKESEFVPIHNDYGYVTVDIDNGKVIGNPNIPNKPRMRVRVKNTTQAKLKKILSKLGFNRSMKEVSIQKILSDEKEFSDSTNVVLQNVRDVGFQNELIEQFLTDKYIIGDSELSIVKDINNDINTKIINSTGLKNIIWKPKRFEFSNMFSYGEDNVIDFTNMKGAYGIFAPNTSGKSSLWDALSFCLFDKCSRTSKALDVLNYSKSTFDCKFNFEINGVDYFIERMAKKSPKRGTVKVNVEFYCIVDGVTHSLNGEERRDTNSIIRQYVGSYDDFILTAMSIQGNNSGFIEKSQKERKELLAQFLDMNVFEQLYQVANDEIKELSALLREYKKENLPDKLSSAEEDLVKHNKHLKDVTIELDEYKKSRSEHQQEIESYINKLKTVDGDVGDIDDLTNERDVLQKKISQQKKLCTEYTKKLTEFEKLFEILSSKYDTYDLDLLYNTSKKYNNLNETKTSTDNKILNLLKSIEHNQKHLDGIGSLSFDDNCEHCISNKNTPFAQQSKTLGIEIDSLKSELANQKSKLNKIISEIDSYDWVHEDLESVQDLKYGMTDTKDSINEYKYKKENCNLTLVTLESKLSKINDNIDNTTKQKESIEHNTKTQSKIDSYKSKLKVIESSTSDLNDRIININGDVRIAENTIDMVNASIDKLAKMEKKYVGYENYLQCVKRDGIPYKLISDILPKLEVEINNILQPIVDFEIVLNTDGKNINSYIAYGDTEFWPLELTSGMEKFISSVAIRTALVNVSNLPRPNFMAIDEGFGSLDSDNFNSLYLLFNYLKNQFDYIITISHIDKTRDMVDYIIDINKMDGFSSIQYL